MTYKILITDGLADEALAFLKQKETIEVLMRPNLAPAELAEQLNEADAIIVRSATKLTASLLQNASKLKVIGRGGVGVDNVDVAAATQMGIVVMNTPDENTITTAEHALSLLFSAARKIPQASCNTKNGEWSKKAFTGTQLSGKILGIVGLGRIGRAVAQRAKAFGMNVIGYDPYFQKEAAADVDVTLVGLPRLLEESDFITIHTPLTDETKHLFDRQAFEKTKPTCILINCARGGIIEEDALLWALQNGRLGGAALDVFEKEPPDKASPLLKEKNVICTPHLGAQTEEAQKGCSTAVARQVYDFLTSGAITNSVNAPSLSREAFLLLQPYLTLSSKLGAFASQLMAAPTEKICIEYDGEISNLKTEALTNSILHGYLKSKLCEIVNPVNARIIARERNIEVIESKSAKSKDFTSLITVQGSGNGHNIEVSGTLFGKTEPRIVKINDHFIETHPEGHILVVRNYDRPGVIGKIGILLSQHNINISRMELGKRKESDTAIALINIDSTAPPEVLKALAETENVISAEQIVV